MVRPVGGCGLRRFLIGMLGFLVALGTPAASLGALPGMTKGVEYVGTLAEMAGGAASIRVVGQHLYVTHYNHFSIYDISKPLSPQRLSTVPISPRPFSMEMVDTNGKIMLITDEPSRTLEIYDVSDPLNPTLLSELAGAGDHTFACLDGCRWAYGSHPKHSIVDLRKPNAPKVVGRWSDGLNVNYAHHLREVAPGRVVTATRPHAYHLDVRNPAKPKVLAQTPDLGLVGRRILSTAQWPQLGSDRFLLLAGETPFSGPCTENSGGLQTWDARRWKATRVFSKIDEYRVDNGTYVDGRPPANALGCSSVFFDHHPRFRDGGLVAVPFLEHGTRFLQVSRDGKIEEVGYFLAHGGEALQSLWINKEILYSVDIVRGIDILRFTGTD